MGNFYTDVIQKSPFFHSTTAVTTPELLEPVTREAVFALLADAKVAGHDLRLYETFRSKERQAMLYQRHVTSLQNVGVHHYGLAADLRLFVDGKYIGAAAPYGFLIDLAEKHGLISGINWGEPGKKHTFIDASHVQRISKARQAKLFAGSWYPDAGYQVLADIGRSTELNQRVERV
jgi:hypothetical protein